MTRSPIYEAYKREKKLANRRRWLYRLYYLALAIVVGVTPAIMTISLAYSLTILFFGYPSRYIWHWVSFYWSLNWQSSHS